jgi:hypothetical protein
VTSITIAAAVITVKPAGLMPVRPHASAARTKKPTVTSRCTAVTTIVTATGHIARVTRRRTAGIGSHRVLAATIGGRSGGKTYLNYLARSLRERRARLRAAVHPRPFIVRRREANT